MFVQITDTPVDYDTGCVEGLSTQSHETAVDSIDMRKRLRDEDYSAFGDFVDLRSG